MKEIRKSSTLGSSICRHMVHICIGLSIVFKLMSVLILRKEEDLHLNSIDNSDESLDIFDESKQNKKKY